jgi:FKBP-type peptidyl-prolyl cis-trans isomerase SlyD
MQITSGKVVSIDYTLTDDEKRVIDTSEGGEPLTYLHGVGQLIPGLEKELEGKTEGAAFLVRIAPEEGYGLRDDAKMAVIPLDRIDGASDLEVGSQLSASKDGVEQVVTVMKIENGMVTIDANHPLAGVTLHFDVTVRGVRAATPDELDHGHVHGPGHEHH